jgi:hypothetical protein
MSSQGPTPVGVCLEVGSTVRFPGLTKVVADPLSSVSCTNQHGTAACVLKTAGPVRFSFGGRQTYVLSLAKRPPSGVPMPGPDGCEGIVTLVVDGGQLPAGLCLHVGASVRFPTNPGSVAVDPQDRAACFYEAALTSCRLLRAGTVYVTYRAEPGTAPGTVTLRVA